MTSSTMIDEFFDQLCGAASPYGPKKSGPAGECVSITPTNSDSTTLQRKDLAIS